MENILSWLSSVSRYFYNSDFPLIDWLKRIHSRRLVLLWLSYRLTGKSDQVFLGQKYTYSNANLWLYVPWLLSLQLGDSGRRPSTSFWLNLAFWHGLVSSCSQWGLSQCFGEGHCKSFILAWFSRSITTYCVFGVIVLLEHPTPPKTQASGWWF